jgi:hypothetical protein
METLLKMCFSSFNDKKIQKVIGYVDFSACIESHINLLFSKTGLAVAHLSPTNSLKLQTGCEPCSHHVEESGICILLFSLNHGYCSLVGPINNIPFSCPSYEPTDTECGHRSHLEDMFPIP